MDRGEHGKVIDACLKHWYSSLFNPHIHTHIHIRAHTYTHTHIHTYAHKRTHTYTHTHTHKHVVVHVLVISVCCFVGFHMHSDKVPNLWLQALTYFADPRSGDACERELQLVLQKIDTPSPGVGPLLPPLMVRCAAHVCLCATPSEDRRQAVFCGR